MFNVFMRFNSFYNLIMKGRSILGVFEANKQHNYNKN